MPPGNRHINRENHRRWLCEIAPPLRRLRPSGAANLIIAMVTWRKRTRSGGRRQLNDRGTACATGCTTNPTGKRGAELFSAPRSRLYCRKDVWRDHVPRSRRCCPQTGGNTKREREKKNCTIHWCWQKPREIIVAVPVVPPVRLDEIRRCDDVVCLHSPETFWVIGPCYDDFRQVEDEEVVEMLRSARAGSGTEPAVSEPAIQKGGTLMRGFQQVIIPS